MWVILKILISLVPIVFLINQVQAQPKPEPKVNMHPLCKNCHQPQPNLMMGILENISYKSEIIQMDLGTHKEVVKFSEKTKLKNVQKLEDIRLYKGRGFSIQYEVKDGQRQALLISRFDVLKIIQPEDKLTKEDFKKFISQNKNVLILDARPPQAYQEAHIPNAKSLPAPAFEKLHSKVLPADKDTPIVYYCVGGCLSPTNYLMTKALGYKNVKIYLGGFPEWTQSEYGYTTSNWLKMAIETGLSHVLIDLRSRETVASGHIKGAISIPLKELDQARGSFPKQKNAPIVLYGDGAEEAAKKIISWGYKAVRILPISFDEWKKLGYPVEVGQVKQTIHYVPKPKPGTITPEEFRKIALNPPPETLIIDVRNPDEVAGGKLKHSINIPLDELPQKVKDIAKDKKIILHCETGLRAEMAHNLLKNLGVESRYLDSKIEIKKDGSFTILE